MNIIICLDNNNGMMFNNRRQSMDRLLRMDILSMVNGNRLLMNSYSKGQFSELSFGGSGFEKSFKTVSKDKISISDNVYVCEDFLDKALENDFAFVENTGISDYEGTISEIFVYRWNRVYPSDMHIDIELGNNLTDIVPSIDKSISLCSHSKLSWKLAESVSFKGSSHDKITREHYIKNS